MEVIMHVHRKIARVIADRGFRGLSQVVVGKFAGRNSDPSANPPPSVVQQKAAYKRNLEEFLEKGRGLGHADISQYYWYHTIDLQKDGLITPGDFDYRDCLPSFKFPPSMAGMNVLDIGSATGFFAFEFEKRGARVVSVELPSIADWDMPTGEDRDHTLRRLMADHQVNSVAKAHHYHLDGPFQFCHRILGSNVRRVYSTVYNLSRANLELAEFDIIYLGDVLLHTFAPLKALAAVAPLCKKTLIIMEHLHDEDDNADPLMFYAGGATPRLDRRTWWYPNKACLVQMLQRLGFKDVEVVGHPDVIYRPEGCIHHTAVIHAHK
jgi:tRNA (mo5U34)-methyltransferase